MRLEDPHRPYVDDVGFPCPHCNERMTRVPEVIDVWFDSGCMPFAQWHAPIENQEHFEARFPADYICEAIDQTRGWFYSLHAVSTLLFEQPAYKSVVCLGHIRDEQDRKMSKSLGNIVVPWDVLDAYGADAFRWYFFTSKQPWDGYRFSVEAVGEGVRLFLKQLWNTYAFLTLYENAAGDAAGRRRPAGEQTELDTLGAVAPRGDGRGGHREPRGVRRDDGRPGDRGVRRRSLQLVRAPLAPPLLGRRPGRLRDAADLPRHRREAARAVHAVRGRRDLRQPRRERAVGAPRRLARREHRRDGVSPRDLGLEVSMATARETVRLGLAARGQAKVKVRQPLREAVIVAAGREREAIEQLEAIVREELNVEALRFVDEAGELGSYEVKANYRTLGPRFGKRMPELVKALAVLDPAHVAAALRDGRTVGVTLGDGEDHPLGADDLQLAMQPLEGYQLEREGSHAVALDLHLDEGLRRRGMAREVIHAVQNARKSAGLAVEDRIALTLGGDAELLDVVWEHEALVASEALATTLEIEPELDSGAQVATIDGRELRIAVAALRPELVRDRELVVVGLRRAGRPRGDGSATADAVSVLACTSRCFWPSLTAAQMRAVRTTLKTARSTAPKAMNPRVCMVPAFRSGSERVSRR